MRSQAGDWRTRSEEGWRRAEEERDRMIEEGSWVGEPGREIGGQAMRDGSAEYYERTQIA